MKALSKVPLAVLVLAIFCLSGCTEEKAKALRLTAEMFVDEADRACAMAATSLKASVAMPPRTRAEISRSLAEATKFGAAELELIYADSGIADSSIVPALGALHQACKAHKQLAAIYTDLPRGYLLATEDIEQAHTHVASVTLRFAELARIVDSMPSTGRDNVARIRIIEAHAKAMAVTDEKARAALLDVVAEDILENQTREALSRGQLLTQFAIATAAGEQLTRMSVDYEQLTGRASVTEDASERIRKVEERLMNDPRLTPWLDAEVARHPGQE
jgi:hypothetical protein